jgi:hypothetical protein
MANRFLLALALKELRKEGKLLHDGNPSSGEVVDWGIRVGRLLEASLDPYFAKWFDRDAGPSEHKSGFDVGAGVKMLDQTIENVVSRRPPKLHPDFNGWDWVSEQG